MNALILIGIVAVFVISFMWEKDELDRREESRNDTKDGDKV